MELKEDKTKVEQVENNVLVTRTIIEEYTAQDYLDSLKRLDSTIEQMEDKQKETKDILDMILDIKIKERCLEIVVEKIALQKSEVEAEIAKQKDEETRKAEIEVEKEEMENPVEVVEKNE